MSRMPFGFSVMFLVLGAFLLVVTGLGQWTNLGRYDCAEPRAWERFDPALVSAIPSFSALVDRTGQQFPPQASDRDKMEVLYRTVSERFTHQDARHTLFTNWILALGGRFVPGLDHVWNPEVLLSKGHSLLCDQSSYVLLKLTLAHGIPARHVGLNGHVVMEAWYDADWHLYDPDLEVVPRESTGEVLSVEELALNDRLLEQYYGPHQAVEIVRSRENNSFVSHPVGARYEWKCNVLSRGEQLAEILKYVIPLIFVAGGVRLVTRRVQIEGMSSVVRDVSVSGQEPARSVRPDSVLSQHETP